MSDIMRNLFMIDKCSHKDIENLLVRRQNVRKQIVDGKEKRIFEITPSQIYDGETLLEPYRSAILLKTLGHKTAALISIISFIEGKGGSYLEEISDYLAENIKESELSESKVKSGTKSYLGSLLKVLCETGLLSEGREDEEGKGGSLRKYYYLKSGIHLQDFKALFEGKGWEGSSSPPSLSMLLKTEYDKKLGELVYVHKPEKYVMGDFKTGIVIESLVKSGLVNTQKSGKQYLSFYDVLDVVEGVKKRILAEYENKSTKALHAEKLTQFILEELNAKNPSGVLSKKYENYIKFRIRKRIINGEEERIDFGKIRKMMVEIASQRGIPLEGELLSHMTEQVVEAIKSMPLTMIKKNLLYDLCEGMISEKIVLISEEEMRNRVKAAENLLETSRLYVKLDAYQARTLLSTVRENCFIALAMRHNEHPPKNPIHLTRLMRTLIGAITRDFSEAKKRNLPEMEALLLASGKGFNISNFLMAVLEEKESLQLEETETLLAVTRIIVSMNSAPPSSPRDGGEDGNLVP